MVVDAIDRHNQVAALDHAIQHTVVHTGQHYDANMSECFFRELTLPVPKYNLEVGSGSHAIQTALMLEKIEDVLLQERPDYVIVYGDTNSTIAAALAAAKLNIPVAHVEAGLRSFNRGMPEEINRLLTDHISTLLFCPTTTAVDNLQHEGIEKGVYLCGDVMLDAILEWRARSNQRARVMERLGIEWGSFVLLTVHRAENTDVPGNLASIFESLLMLPYPVVFPLHPRTRARIDSDSLLSALWREVIASPSIKVLDPVSYLDMLVLEESARVVVTDSGGVQKEAYFLGVPCITVRRETEWIETLRDGWNRLVAPDDRRVLVHTIMRVWETDGAALRANTDRSAFGEGRAAEEIVRVLAQTSSMTTGRAA